MTSDIPGERARIIKASPLLQAKVGSGTITDDVVEKMQQVMDETQIDFAPMAQKFLDQLEDALKKAQAGNGDAALQIARMVEPVMQIKGNAGMFGYELVGSLAGTVLNFLESIKAVDKSVLEIVEAHHKTLSLIVKSKMTGSGGAHGAQLQNELQDACKRYYTKMGITPAQP
ncbi:MAG: hypothetical protein HYU57_06620 [Micavibrio aeruginosavorus]|nr:hypothetical protein [Micavibrio aeruginosavorus]